MTCNPTRIEISNAAATVVEFTVTPDPGAVSLTFQVDALSIDETITLSAGVGSVTIASQTQADFSIFDGTIQVGSGSAILVPVMVIESNVQQAVGVNISGTDVTYCAPTSGGGTTPSEPVIEYVYGTHSLLAEIKEQPAHVSFVGDSISNNANTDFASLFHGALFEWRPDQWKGAWFHTNASGVGMFVNGQDVTSENSRPAGTGSMQPSSLDNKTSNWTRAGNAGSATTQDWDFQFYVDNLSPLAATRQNAQGDAVLAQWPDGSYIFRDADGNRSIATANTDVRMAAQMIGYGSTGFVTNFDVRIYDPNTQTDNWNSQTLTTDSDYWSDTLERQRLTLTDYDGSEGGFWTLQIRNDNQAGDKEVIESVFWGTDDPGLELSYFGDGGWRTRNHFPPGETITTTQGTEAYHYTTDALAGRMAALGTTHALVFLGMNDVTAAGRSGEDVLTDFDTVLSNIRTARPGVKIVALTLYTTDTDDATKIASKATFNAGLKTRAAAASDLVVVDIHQYIVDTWTTQAAFSAAWLFDVTHFNQAGAAAISSFIWSKVVESTGGVLSVQGRTGQVVLTAADFAPVADSYLMFIESPTTKTYVLDVASAAARTITAFRGRTSAGSCAVTLKSNGGLATVASLTASATQAPTSATSLSNTGISFGERIELEVTSNLSAENLQIVVDYTQ